jgi:hypothetical protein
MTKHPTKFSRAIFVHLSLDEAGLDPYEFRLIAHIARRKRCFASLAKTAKICRMSVRKAQYALKSLYDKGFIVKKTRPGHTDIYELAPNLLDKLIEGVELDVDTLTAESKHPDTAPTEIDPVAWELFNLEQKTEYRRRKSNAL